MVNGVFMPDRTKNTLTGEHEIDCPLKCSNGGHKMALMDVKRHIRTECPNVTVSCPMASFGCKVRLKRGEVDEHMKTDSHSHLAMAFFMKSSSAFQTTIGEIKTQIGGLVTQCEEYKTQLREQSDLVTSLKSEVSGLKDAHAATKAKLQEMIDGENAEYSLKVIATNTKKRARPGQSANPRTVRHYAQLEREKQQTKDLEEVGEEEANKE